MFVLIARQCTARCSQRVAPRKWNTVECIFIGKTICNSAEPHVASNVRYMHSRWKQTPHSNVWPSGKDTYYIYGICNENKHLTHTPSSNVQYVAYLGVQPTRTSNVQTFPHSSFENTFKARLKRQNTYPKLSKRGMKWFLHYFFTDLAVLPHRVSVLLHCKREGGTRQWLPPLPRFEFAAPCI